MLPTQGSAYTEGVRLQEFIAWIPASDEYLYPEHLLRTAEWFRVAHLTAATIEPNQCQEDARGAPTRGEPVVIIPVSAECLDGSHDSPRVAPAYRTTRRQAGSRLVPEKSSEQDNGYFSAYFFREGKYPVTATPVLRSPV